ncbi:uncharacterized protein TNCV_2575191 [Trichonephila clavipes]|nr:uncharacterized protein TNCV_2575191 [Trichonephila clavipes]
MAQSTEEQVEREGGLGEERYCKVKIERKTHGENRGSVKCGKTCPAFMTAIREQKEEAIKITVQYQSVCCDDNHEGLPIAVCYSNRVSSDVLEPFFEEIKNRLPHLKPKVFMSDDDPAFCNAWSRVFGEVEFTLLCSWHVSRSWNRNLNGKIKNNIKLKEEMGDKLKKLMNEIHVVTFERMYEDFVQEYTKNEESKNFVEYYVKSYGGRKQKWAYCYRVGCEINTNMKLERWHRELKYEEGGGKALRRLGKSLSLVLRTI